VHHAGSGVGDRHALRRRNHQQQRRQLLERLLPELCAARTSVGVASQTATSFTTRFAESIAADARLTTPISTSLSSNYTINFDVICPIGGYRLTVTSHLRGAFTHGDDSLGCGVGGDASRISPASPAPRAAAR